MGARRLLGSASRREASVGDTSMSAEARPQERFELTASIARTHAMKNCLATIEAACDVMERQDATANGRLWESVRLASKRLGDFLAEQLATEMVRSFATPRRHE